MRRLPTRSALVPIQLGAIKGPRKFFQDLGLTGWDHVEVAPALQLRVKKGYEVEVEDVGEPGKPAWKITPTGGPTSVVKPRVGAKAAGSAPTSGVLPLLIPLAALGAQAATSALQASSENRSRIAESPWAALPPDHRTPPPTSPQVPGSGTARTPLLKIPSRGGKKASVKLQPLKSGKLQPLSRGSNRGKPQAGRLIPLDSAIGLSYDPTSSGVGDPVLSRDPQIGIDTDGLEVPLSSGLSWT